MSKGDDVRRQAQRPFPRPPRPSSVPPDLRGGIKGTVSPVEESYDYLVLEVGELRSLLRRLLARYRLTDESLKALTHRAVDLLKENRTLQEKCFNAEKKRIVAEAEVEELLKQEKNLASTRELIDRQEEEKHRNKCDASTSVEGLLQEDKCPLCCATMFKGDAKAEEVMKLAKEQLQEVDNNLVEIKEALQGKTNIVNKSREKDKCRQKKIQKLTWEIQSLKNLVSYKSHELDNKTRELQVKAHELAQAKKEIQRLHVSMNQLVTKKMSAPCKTAKASETVCCPSLVMGTRLCRKALSIPGALSLDFTSSTSPESPRSTS